MNTVRQSCRPKHQVLILKCYPRFQKGVQEVKPNSSELSYLLYYASTRRSKLQKVGAFLEKRAARDVWRGKNGNVQVTLQILTALIEKLPRDLPLYARSVLTVIETVLHSNDISMVEETVPTFETFCRHQDIAALAAEQEHANQYHNIVRTYATFASTDPLVHSKTPLSAPIAMRWRTAGLQAIKSIVSSEAVATDGGKQLSLVVPVILDNLYSGGEDVLVSLETIAQNLEKDELEQARRRRMSVATVQTVDTVDGNAATASGSTAEADKVAEVEVRVLALRCLERIFVSGSNRGQIRIATSLVLSFLTSRNPLRSSEKDQASVTDGSGNWAASLIELIAKWCPVQDRFIILVTTMEALLDTPATEDKLEQQLALVSLIDWLLKSSVNMIGLSVMDVLLGLVKSILRLLQLQTRTPSQSSSAAQGEETKEAAVDAATGASRAPSPIRHALLTLLQECIGDLATHIYYGDQVSDMIRTILARLKPSVTPEISTASAVEDPSGAVTAIANSANLQEDPNTDAFFSFATARVTALKAVKKILVVANQRTPMASAGVEARNKVGIQVWEGTQWLLRDPDGDVRNAYVDALLSWLQLETNKNDLKIKGESKGLSRMRSKLEMVETADKAAKRVVSTASHREKASIAAQISFLQLLHLAIYDNAVEFARVESDILLLHLLLAKLVEHLGVNAARSGVPMVLKLQDDIATSQALSSFVAKINVSSLVYGYLWALCEKFNCDTSKVGGDIYREISKRQKLGLWLDRIRLPPLPLDHILPGTDTKAIGQYAGTSDALVPFRAVEELVQHIENAYNESLVSPAQSPPSSPGRSFNVSPLGQGYSTTPTIKRPREDPLPSDIKEQMLSRWSKEACLAAVEKESAATLSLNGSRTGTLGTRSYLHLNGAGNGSPTGTGSPTSIHRGLPSGTHAPPGAGGIMNHRRTSAGEGWHTPISSSSRDSTVRVNELRRVLSVTNNSNVRRSSPLRGRLDLSSSSIVTSSSESVVSGAFSTSDIGGGDRLSRPQSLKEGSATSDRDGSETPRASAAYLARENTQLGQSTPLSRYDFNGIPPVPPLPLTLPVPGGFPDSASSSSRRSSPVLDRPSTAPSSGIRASLKGRSEASPVPRQSISLNRQKSRSSSGLSYAIANAAPKKRVSSGVIDGYGRGESGSEREVENSDLTTSAEQRAEVEELLDVIIPRDGRKEEKHNGRPIGPAQIFSANSRSGKNPSSPTVGNRDSRRLSIGRGGVGGIGRPPY